MNTNTNAEICRGIWKNTLSPKTQKTTQNPAFYGISSHREEVVKGDKNTIRLPRQHMQESDGGIRNEGYGT